MRSLGVAALAGALFVTAAGWFTLSEVQGESKPKVTRTTEVIHEAPPETGPQPDNDNEQLPTPEEAVDRGIDWLVSVQGDDGGWGQDGGETSYVRQAKRL